MPYHLLRKDELIPKYFLKIKIKIYKNSGSGTNPNLKRKDIIKKEKIKINLYF